MRRGEVRRGSAWALVTGAGSGIGRCFALRLADLGYNLILVGNNPEPLRKVQEELRTKKEITVRTLSMDLARLEAAEELTESIGAAGIEIDLVINNAGIFSFCDVLKMDEKKMERMLLLHDMTTTKLCRYYAERMVARGVKGHILNVASYSQWMPYPGLAIYGATKAYLKAFSVAFSKEVEEHGITVTAICPAGVATDLYGLPSKLQRLGVKIGGLITPDRCAKRGLNALWRGKRCSVPDWWNRLWIPLLVAMPMFILRPIRRWTMKFQK
ncbi:MAG: SDR family NAD(P)-dependent oxidoreductase [Rikenellaceae bacterium]|nr:SDR family NAD(P)-dependent oxidoreductase [Rikenellaceae bacterium]